MCWDIVCCEYGIHRPHVCWKLRPQNTKTINYKWHSEDDESRQKSPSYFCKSQGPSSTTADSTNKRGAKKHEEAKQLTHSKLAEQNSQKIQLILTDRFEVNVFSLRLVRGRNSILFFSCCVSYVFAPLKSIEVFCTIILEGFPSISMLLWFT